MKKRIAAWIYILLALALCLTPGLGLLIAGPSEAGANEVPARLPELTGRDGELNSDYLSQLADYAGESFYLRQELITLYARALALFGRSAEEDVVLGEDGWLYYADELGDYSGTAALGAREAFAAARNLALMREYCESLGAEFLFFIAPNKSSLYPGHMPSSYPRALSAGRAELLHGELERQGVAYLDLFGLFISREEELYFAHDSHWNSRGAALAADAVCSALELPGGYFSGQFGPAEAHSGDLFEMLYPAAADPETDSTPQGLSFTQGEGVRPDSITIDTTGGGSGSLLMFRDSFGELLYPYLADSFASARFSRQTAYDLTMAAQLGSTAVVVEIVERNLGWLVEQSAVFPAPERELDLSAAAEGAACELESSGQAPEGLHRVSGRLGAACDADSPVYIARGGAVYEASLLSGGGFTACLPGEGGGDYTVCWYQDGALRSAGASI